MIPATGLIFPCLKEIESATLSESELSLWATSSGGKYTTWNESLDGRVRVGYV